MAAKSSLEEEDLSCPVCFDIFRDPVLLLCSHSFCRACLEEYWRDKYIKECPVCRAESTTRHLPSNRALKNLCDIFLQQRHRKPDRQQGSEQSCSIHGEKLKAFCLTDQQPVCWVCRDSRKHARHRFSPIEEVALDYKNEIKKSLEPLKKKVDEMDEIKQRFDRTADFINFQTEHTEKLIKEEFKRLYEFLHAEEQARIDALRDEGAQKSAKIKEKVEGLSGEISSLKDAIRDVEAELKADDVLFLQNYKGTVRKTIYNPKPYPKLAWGAMLDVAEHLGNLCFKVWEKMQHQVSYTPVVLDPNTANPYFVLGNNLTSVTRVGAQPLPNNPERFDYWYSVLGWRGLDSGVHTWDVEVGDNRSWQLGVAPLHIQRKGNVRGGSWRFGLSSGVYTATRPSGPGRQVFLNHNPKKIRVRLDFSRGLLSFSDPDRKVHLQTFKSSFHERLFPWFFSGKSSSPSLKLLPQKISVTVEQDSYAYSFEDQFEGDYYCDDSDSPSAHSLDEDEYYYYTDEEPAFASSDELYFW